jgi:integrase
MLGSYLGLADVKAKKTYQRDIQSINRLIPFFRDKLLKNITPALVRHYQQQRLTEPSGRSPKHLTKPATVNREIACFKTIFNRAIENGRAERYPLKGVKMLKENNERERVLTIEEYYRLLAHCPPHLKPIIKVAYYTGMRQGEILNLTWGQVDLKEGFINLRVEDTKTEEARSVPLTDELIEMFKAMREVLHMPQVKVFNYAGRSVGSIKRAFSTACKKAGIEDFTFHDFRHTAINNWRLQGHDYFRIMATSAHKTMHVFKSYNTVSKEELKDLVGEKNGSDGHLFGHQGQEEAVNTERP